MRPPRTLDGGSCVCIRGNSNSTPATEVPVDGARSPIVSLPTPQELEKIYSLFSLSVTVLFRSREVKANF